MNKFSINHHGLKSKAAACLLVFRLATMLGWSANTFYVATNGNDLALGDNWANALLTISNAVAMATGVSDQVILSNGVHYLSGQIVITNAITVRGMTTNRENVIVNGNYPATTNRCFFLARAGAEVADLTITNGFATDTEIPYSAKGGGVYINTNGSVRNCLITGNTVTNYGGGIYLYRGGTVTNCAIAGNISSNLTDARGGGVYCYILGNVFDCLISNNQATVHADAKGGGLYVDQGGLVRNCEIVNNLANGRGGGLYQTAPGMITNCLIRNNAVLIGANHGGGGVYQNGGVVANCRIIGNDAGPAGTGGGVRFFQANTHPLVQNCLIISNKASSYAGGVYWAAADGLIRNCLITGNSATNGAGMYIGAAGTAVNCTVVGNVATNGGGGVMSTGGQLVNCIIYTNQALLGDPAWQNWTNSGATMTYSNCCTLPVAGLPGSGNIESDPLFSDYNAFNFRVRDASPCINAGLNQGWMIGAVDLAGQPRIRHKTVDMGAYETLMRGTIIMIH